MLQTSCQAAFRKETRSIEDISCASPVGDGALLLTGSVQEVRTLPQANLTLEIDRVPAAVVLTGLQEVRSGLGAGVQVAGALNGDFHYTSQRGRQPLISGEATLASLSLTPPDSDKPFVLAPVRVKCDSPEPGTPLRLPALLLHRCGWRWVRRSPRAGWPLHGRRIRSPLERRPPAWPGCRPSIGRSDCLAHIALAFRL